MHRRSPLPPRRSRLAGFSLMELSIVVAIMGVMATMGLGVSASFVNRSAYKETNDKLKAADEAIDQFFNIYGRLPCAADRTLPITDPAYGQEMNLANCALAVLPDTSAPTPYIGGGVVAGALPFRTLNLPLSASLDGFGNKINYFVTLNLTRAGTSAGQFGYNSVAVPADAGIAGIEIHSGTLAASSVSAAVTADFVGNTGAAYAVFSNGADQRGAYSRNGVLHPCIPATSFNSYIDSQNCISTGGTLGVAGIPSYVLFDQGAVNSGSGAGARYFDDMIVWRPRLRL